MNPWTSASLQVNAWDSASPELLAPLRKAGYTRVEVLLNALRQDPPLEPPTRAYVDRLKAAGFNVWGVVWADYYSYAPTVCSDFCEHERKRFNLNGFVINAEDGVEAADQEERQWSRYFLDYFRRSFPRLPLALNTYIGCGGIDLPAWEQANARLIVQTHHEATEPYCWSPAGYKVWAKKYGWTNLAKIKPQWGIFKGNDGNRVPVETFVQAAVVAKTVGYSAYYAESCFDEPEHMVALYNQAKAKGVVA